MDQHQQKGPSQREQYAAFVSWLAFLCQILECSVAVFLRQGVGRRYLGLQAISVVPVVMIYATFWPKDDPRPLLVYLGVYVAACAITQLGSLRRQWRGEVEHSRYSGRPSVMRLPVFRRWLGERVAKGVVEPMIVIFAGWFLMRFNEPLGSYLIAAAIGLVLSVGFARASEQQRLMDTRDAYFEQQHLAERFRDGDWR